VFVLSFFKEFVPFKLPSGEILEVMITDVPHQREKIDNKNKTENIRLFREVRIRKLPMVILEKALLLLRKRAIPFIGAHCYNILTSYIDGETKDNNSITTTWMPTNCYDHFSLLNNERI